NESGVDTAAVLVALYSSTDSTRIAYHARCDTTGAYQMRNVAPGDYTLRAFVDVKPDSAPGFYPCPAQPDKGCPEPMVRAPAPVAVKPAQVTTVPPVVIPRKEE
ncbi:MAG TPA: hypothetical protein VFH88_02540, partial [Candidatus Krumholzibacteria bacterium]|nr:hypothetical protein [Candidatus Krumholzibacteria bacterium]